MIAAAFGILVIVGALFLLPSALLARRLVAPRPFRSKLHVVAETTCTIDIVPDGDAALDGEFAIRSWNGASRNVGQVIDRTATYVRRFSPRTSAEGWVGPASWSSTIFDEYDFDWDQSSRPDLLIRGPRTAPTAAIHLHGHSSTSEQTFRGVASLADHGIRSLVPRLPAKPTFGRSESAAVLSAVERARADGAENVIVVAWSAGVLAAASALKLGAPIDGLVLVSPVFSPRQFVLDLARSRRLPRITAKVAIALASSRFAALLGGDRLDMSDNSHALAQRPSVAIHSAGDTTSKLSRSEEFSDSARLNSLVRTRNAPHTLEWNVDRSEWERGVADFLHTQRMCSVHLQS